MKPEFFLGIAIALLAVLAIGWGGQMASERVADDCKLRGSFRVEEAVFDCQPRIDR